MSESEWVEISHKRYWQLRLSSKETFLAKFDNGQVFIKYVDLDEGSLGGAKGKKLIINDQNLD